MINIKKIFMSAMLLGLLASCAPNINNEQNDTNELPEINDIVNVHSLEEFDSLENGKMKFKASFVGPKSLINPDTGFVLKLKDTLRKKLRFNYLNVIVGTKENNEIIDYEVVDYLEKVEDYNCKEVSYSEALKISEGKEIFKLKHVLYQAVEKQNINIGEMEKEIDVHVYITNDGHRAEFSCMNDGYSYIPDAIIGHYYDFVICNCTEITYENLAVPRFDTAIYYESK